MLECPFFTFQDTFRRFPATPRSHSLFSRSIPATALSPRPFLATSCRSSLPARRILPVRTILPVRRILPQLVLFLPQSVLFLPQSPSLSSPKITISLFDSCHFSIIRKLAGFAGIHHFPANYSTLVLTLFLGLP